jgi:hypothetical protein
MALYGFHCYRTIIEQSSTIKGCLDGNRNKPEENVSEHQKMRSVRLQPALIQPQADGGPIKEAALLTKHESHLEHQHERSCFGTLIIVRGYTLKVAILYRSRSYYQCFFLESLLPDERIRGQKSSLDRSHLSKNPTRQL